MYTLYTCSMHENRPQFSSRFRMKTLHFSIVSDSSYIHFISAMRAMNACG